MSSPRPVDTDRLFPTLTTAQTERIASHGRRRPAARGDVLVDVGDRNMPFFVVVSGEIQVLDPSGESDALLATHRLGGFSGDVHMISGRPALARLQVSESGEVIEVPREQLLEVVQTDSELGELLMRAFILRRVELIERGAGGVVLLGSLHCADTLRVQEFLTRNGHPFAYVDLDRDPDVQQLLDRFHVVAADVPLAVQTGEGAHIPARAVIIASGADYRKPALENLARFTGAGVYYAATRMEAQLCANEEVIVVGGGNSAGQARCSLRRA